MSRRHQHVVNVEEVSPTAQSKGKRYGFERRALGAATGGKGLGCSHMVVPPGRSAWPRHWHASNDEALFVLKGAGTLSIGEARVALRPGDYVALPPGPDSAHLLTNDGPGPLEYLALSTMIPTDMTIYPASGKVGLFAGSAPGGPKEARFLDGFLRLDARVDYWEGEDVD
jgi:uncharacterized cupin superfamily protein